MAAVEILEMKAPDDCMSPTIDAGDTILVDRRRRQVQHEGIYAIRGERGSQVRRILFLSEWLVRVVCDNPIYPALETQLDQLKIVGQVIFCFRIFI